MLSIQRISISILYENIERTASVVSTYNRFNNSENVQNTRYSGDTSGKEPAYQCRRLKRHGIDPWVGKIPQRRKWLFLPGESHEQRSLAGYSPWGCKELDMTANDPLSFLARLFLHILACLGQKSLGCTKEGLWLKASPGIWEIWCYDLEII